MNGTVREWVDKAEGDFRTAQREFQALDEPNFDAACFHAQQCVEKLMKAILIQKHAPAPKIHDLERLYELLTPASPGVAFDVEELRSLTSVGIAARYPGEAADREDAATALDICKRLREGLLRALNTGNV